MLHIIGMGDNVVDITDAGATFPAVIASMSLSFPSILAIVLLYGVVGNDRGRARTRGAERQNHTISNKREDGQCRIELKTAIDNFRSMT